MLSRDENLSPLPMLAASAKELGNYLRRAKYRKMLSVSVDQFWPL